MVNTVNSYVEALIAECIVSERNPTDDPRWRRVLANGLTDGEKDELKSWFGREMPAWRPLPDRSQALSCVGAVMLMACGAFLGAFVWALVRGAA